MDVPSVTDPASTTTSADATERPDIRTVAKSRRSALIGALFLMATSAIGPGFITQTATFTAQMGAAFAFGILASILIVFAVQLNIWRMITVSGKRAPELIARRKPPTRHPPPVQP